MEELIFFAVIIFFSILESIARSRKAKQQSEQGPPTTAEPERFEWAQTPPWEREVPEQEFETRPRELEQTSWDDDLATYDEDPSYDDRIVRDEAASREEGRPATADTAADIWAEIAGLAAGRTPSRTSRLPLPDYVPTRPAPPVRRVPVPVQRPRETRVAIPTPRPEGVDEHRIHLAHAGYGTDPSGRAPSEQDLLYAQRERLGPDAAAARALLRGSPSSLRQAVILHEVLGPPASTRHL